MLNIFLNLIKLRKIRIFEFTLRSDIIINQINLKKQIILRHPVSPILVFIYINNANTDPNQTDINNTAIMYTSCYHSAPDMTLLSSRQHTASIIYILQYPLIQFGST